MSSNTSPSFELLDPAVISEMGSLELIATRIVEGPFAGSHRSPYKGSSIEFAEHRLYSPGDELRLIDWRALARSERYYVKQFEQETNLHAVLVLDASGSMGFGQSTISKLRYGQMTCACLARLMIRQRDSVGLAVVDTHIRDFIPARSRPAHLPVLVDALARAQAAGGTGLAAALTELAARLKRRGLVIICSDAFDEVEKLLKAMHLLRARGQDLLLLQVMAPEELSFRFNRWTQFESLEAQGERLELDPAAVRRAYLERVEAFLDRLRSGCGELECDYMLLRTDQPLGPALAFFLARRTARVKW